ncbi:MAG TPA: TlpA disulfide reductase family protein [Paludibacter sp.]|nr:TlpA disulfide reductase family protein [Paludibacter sp.]
MKKSIILGLVFIMFFSSFQSNKTATLSGKIEKSDKTPLLINDFKISISFDTINLINGRFNQTVQTENAGFKTLKYGQTQKEIFLAPDYSLKISFDATNFGSTLKYEGKGATENRILDSISISTRNFDYRFVYTQPLEIATKYIDSTYDAYQKYFEKLTVVNKVDPIFFEYEKKSLSYSASALKTVLGLQKNIADTSYYRFFNKITIENDKYLDIPSYRNFLQYYINVKTRNILAKMDSSESKLPHAYSNAALKVIDEIKNKKLKEYLVFENTKSKLKFEGADHFEKQKEYFKKNNTDSIYAREIRKIYTKKLLLASGKEAPGFTCTDINGSNYSLNDFKGKYVYIDFWATWCGPCRQEMPGYLKLQSDYKGKDIAFISISIDEDKGSWEKVVKESKADGISLITTGGIDSNVAKAYQINGIPTFVLIDKAGKIINSQAQRPSDNNLRKTLDALLQNQ